MLAREEKNYRRIMVVLMAALGVLVIGTFRDYGITWDEELQSQYGLAVVDYYASFFHDDRYREIFNLYLYGGMFDGLASLIDRYTPFIVYDTRHLLNAGFGLLGIWGTWRLGRTLGGGLVGLLAMGMLAITPMYYGHMFNNPKDIPFACGIVWSLYFMIRSYGQLPRPSWKILIKLSIVYGLTLGVRVGGVMLFAMWLVPMGMPILINLFYERSWAGFRKAFRDNLNLTWRVIFPVAILSYAVMLICWPWAQQDPIINPLRALSEFSNFPQDVEVLLNGITYRSTQLPWYYVPVYFFVQLPEMLLACFALSSVTLPWRWLRFSLHRKQSVALLMLMAIVPICYAIMRQPALYDAVRHFLFVVPILCVLSALWVVAASRWAAAEFEKELSRRLITAGIISIFVICSFAQITIMIRLHPYEYIFANHFIGGVAGAYGKYETDYWGTSFKESAERLQAYVAAEGGIPPGKIYRVAICGPWDSAMIYLPPDYEPVVANEPAEFFLSTTRWMCQNMRPGKEIIRVERMGVPLSIIKDLRK